MATELWVEVVCARCAASGPGRHVTDHRLPRPELRREALRKGWEVVDDDMYCSSKCLEAREESND